MDYSQNQQSGPERQQSVTSDANVDLAQSEGLNSFEALNREAPNSQEGTDSSHELPSSPTMGSIPGDLLLPGESEAKKIERASIDASKHGFDQPPEAEQPSAETLTAQAPEALIPEILSGSQPSFGESDASHIPAFANLNTQGSLDATGVKIVEGGLDDFYRSGNAEKLLEKYYQALEANLNNSYPDRKGLKL